MPRFETSENLADENRAKLMIATRWSCVPKKLPDRYEVDFALFVDADLRGWLEYKRRHNVWEAYRHVHLSAMKYERLIELGERTGRPSWCLFEFDPEGTYGLHRANRGVLLRGLGWGGRKDRGLESDEETVALIEWAEIERSF